MLRHSWIKTPSAGRDRSEADAHQPSAIDATVRGICIRRKPKSTALLLKPQRKLAQLPLCHSLPEMIPFPVRCPLVQTDQTSAPKRFRRRDRRHRCSARHMFRSDDRKKFRSWLPAGPLALPSHPWLRCPLRFRPTARHPCRMLCRISFRIFLQSAALPEVRS